MCFTINIHTTRSAIEQRFNADASVLDNFDFRYFYRAFDRPLIPVISQDAPEKVQLMEWGLIPRWARDAEHAEMIRRGTYNARAESLSEKPSFRESFAGKRCLVIVSGFFEWQHRAGSRIPWYICHKELPLITLGGIFDQWKAPGSDTGLQTFSIITVRANPLMARIHNTKKRMPLLFEKEMERDWLNESNTREENERLMVPFNEAVLNAWTIGNAVTGAEADPYNASMLDPVAYPVDGKLF
jgi:putative SOS response-associated peptidase YedK